jgi:hypothetical protein
MFVIAASSTLIATSKSFSQSSIPSTLAGASVNVEFAVLLNVLKSKPESTPVKDEHCDFRSAFFFDSKEIHIFV